MIGQKRGSGSGPGGASNAVGLIIAVSALIPGCYERPDWQTVWTVLAPKRIVGQAHEVAMVWRPSGSDCRARQSVEMKRSYRLPSLRTQSRFSRGRDRVQHDYFIHVIR